MATTSNPQPPGGATKIGELYAAVDALKNEAVNLFNAYESDDPVYDLIERAATVRAQVAQIEEVLNIIAAALSNLGS